MAGSTDMGQTNILSNERETNTNLWTSSGVFFSEGGRTIVGHGHLRECQSASWKGLWRDLLLIMAILAWGRGEGGGEEREWWLIMCLGVETAKVAIIFS